MCKRITTPCNILETTNLGTKLYPDVLIFHAQIEENSTDNLCFIKKKCYQGDLEKFES